ncbi:acyltransferase family protein [Rhodococcus kronopolitis]|uniref:Acyltransferase family protein n=1 Tax=Rhodococcus kronopolitis TaxID=1460226 RepID=A0ABV9FP35_9NOCA
MAVSVDLVAAPRPVTRIGALTGLRAVAALLVVGTHVGFWTGRYTDDLIGAVYARLEIGVTVFFVLSGFLLFRPWLRAAAGERELPTTRDYLWHRARRILPAYWIAVIAVYAVYLFRDPGVTGLGWSGFARNLTLTQIYRAGDLHVGLTQMWSLAVEVSFYLVLPVLGWLIVSVICRGQWRPGRIAAALTGIVAVTPLWTVFTHGDAGLPYVARLWLPGFVAWFAGGMLLALAAVTVRRCNPYAAGALALYFFALACTPLAGEATIVPAAASDAVAKSMLYLLAAVCLVAPLVVGDDAGPLGRLCASAPVVWLGEISYELFLVHLLVLELVFAALGYRTFEGSTLLVFAVTVAISVPVSWALHRTVGRLVR